MSCRMCLHLVVSCMRQVLVLSLWTSCLCFSSAGRRDEIDSWRNIADLTTTTTTTTTTTITTTTTTNNNNNYDKLADLRMEPDFQRRSHTSNERCFASSLVARSSTLK